MENKDGLKRHNYIQLKGDAGWYSVIEIYQDTVKIFGGARDYEVHNIGKVRGIPITEEILLRSGFKKQLGFFKTISGEPGKEGWKTIEVCEMEPKKWVVYLREGKDEGYEYDYVCVRNNYEYLHQLQNLYFALTENHIDIN